MKTNNEILHSEKLIPHLSADDKKNMLAYFKVYEKHAENFSNKVVEDLKFHPVFGKLIQSIPKPALKEMSKISNDLQKNAIENNNWQPYIEYQIGQGINYAKMGLDFKSWYEVVALLRDYLRPYLYEKYGNGSEFISALKGMNSFLDIAMGCIGEAYVREKEEIILAEKKKIHQLNQMLEQKVKLRTKQLEEANKELEAFTYSVSHDLRAPLRAINGFSEMLIEDYGTKLDEDGKRIINTICKNATKMGKLIDDLLAFSRLGRKEMIMTEIDMKILIDEVLAEINTSYHHKAEIKISNIINVKADNGLMHQLMLNLISNAVKYSSKKKNPKVQISSKLEKDEVIYTIKDNGAGFDMKYADKLFGVFQRLHSQEEFEGTGVGLAIVHRVISRHKGRIWASSKLNVGSEFNFSLPID